MKLPMPPMQYDRRHEIERNRQLEQADLLLHKRGSDIEVHPGRVILTSPNGARWSLTINNAGALSAVAL